MEIMKTDQINLSFFMEIMKTDQITDLNLCWEQSLNRLTCQVAASFISISFKGNKTQLPCVKIKIYSIKCLLYF